MWTPLWREKGRLRPTALVPDTARPVPPPGLCRPGRFPHRLRLAGSPQLSGATSWLVSWKRPPARLPGVWTSGSPSRALRATGRTLAFHVREVGALGSLGLGKAVNGL